MVLTIKHEAFCDIVKKMNSKTIPILAYLIDVARDNQGEIPLTYKNVEETLGIGKTAVGESMRLLIKNNLIIKTASGKYRINPSVINIEKREVTF